MEPRYYENACLGQGEDVFILRIQSPPEKGNGTYIVCWGGDCTPQASSDNMTIDAYRGWAVIENVCPCLGILIRMVVCLIPRGFMRSCSLSWICWVGDVVRIRSHSCITMIANEENHGSLFWKILLYSVPAQIIRHLEVRVRRLWMCWIVGLFSGFTSWLENLLVSPWKSTTIF